MGNLAFGDLAGGSGRGQSDLLLSIDVAAVWIQVSVQLSAMHERRRVVVSHGRPGVSPVQEEAVVL